MGHKYGTVLLIGMAFCLLLACCLCGVAILGSKKGPAPDSRAAAGTLAKTSRQTIQGGPKQKQKQKQAAAEPSSTTKSGGATYSNPVMLNLADPGCIRVGSTYYVSGTGQGGYAIHASSDLIKWSHVGDTGQGGCGQCWAPNFMQRGGKFYLCFTDGGSLTSSIAVADSVKGPYRMILQGGIPGIDPYLYEHTDGKVYVFFNRIRAGAILSVGIMSPDLKQMVDSKDLFSGPVAGQPEPTVEAPVVIREGGLLYLIFSTSGTGKWYNCSYATSSSPLGPWKQSGEVLFPVDYSGHGHCDVVKTASGKYICVYHGAAWVNNGRNLCVDNMTIGGGKVSIQYTGQGKQGALHL